ncbi:MAG: hypothetical protein RIC56_19890 [Pseudomonadales bacterium]
MKTHPATKLGIALVGGLLVLSTFSRCAQPYVLQQQIDDQLNWQMQQNEVLQQQMMQSLNSNPYADPFAGQAQNPYAQQPMNPYGPGFNSNPYQNPPADGGYWRSSAADDGAAPDSQDR